MSASDPLRTLKANVQIVPKLRGAAVILFSQIRGAIGEIQRREWALLCLETLGVLVGIFIAFQLNEWATGRREASRNREMIDRLFDETQRNISWLREQRTRAETITSNEVKFATELVHESRCPADGEMWKSVYTVTWYPPMVVETSVYDEMMGAGGLATIEDSYARRAVSRFHTDLNQIKERIGFIRARTSPAIELDDPRSHASYDPTKDDPLAYTFDRNALCGDASFKNRVADKVRDHEVVMDQRSDLVRSAIEMCSSLGKIMGRRCMPFRGGPLVGQDAKFADEAWEEAGKR